MLMFIFIFVFCECATALIFKGISLFGDQTNFPKLEEIGANAISLDLPWKKIEQVIIEPVPSIAQMRQDQELIREYCQQVDWSWLDQKVQEAAENDFLLLPWIACGIMESVPQFQGQEFQPDSAGQEFYLACAYRHARAIQERYHFPWVLVEGELNEAQLSCLFGWRKSLAWSEPDFLSRLIETLVLAIKDTDPQCQVGTVLHTDIHPNIHQDSMGKAIAGPNDWTQWLIIWGKSLDFIGINVYPYYYMADNPGGFLPGSELGERVSIAKKLLPAGKKVFVTETAYPAPAPGKSFPEPLDFTEAKQAQYLQTAFATAIAAGADGFFWFTLETAGILGPLCADKKSWCDYTAEDLEALAVLGKAFGEGNVQTLLDYAFAHYLYVTTRLPTVLSAVELGWGLMNWYGYERPALRVLQECFQSVPDQRPYDQFVLKLEQGWNLINFPLDLFVQKADKVFGQLDDRLLAAWGFTQAQWSLYAPNIPSASFPLESAKGYWVEMAAPAKLVVYGRASGTRQINLVAGWNLVGFPDKVPRMVSEVWSSLQGQCQTIRGYDSILGWQDYMPDLGLQSLKIMEPGKGYWFYMKKDCVLVF